MCVIVPPICLLPNSTYDILRQCIIKEGGSQQQKKQTKRDRAGSEIQITWNEVSEEMNDSGNAELLELKNL